MSKIKEQLLAHLQNEVFCRLGVSTVHGIGVFAVREIPEGENPLASRLNYKEVKFSHAELKKLPRGVRKEIDIFCYYDKDAVFVPEIGMNSMNMAIYLNHSKEPNVRYRKNGQLKALKDIRLTSQGEFGFKFIGLIEVIFDGSFGSTCDKNKGLDACSNGLFDGILDERLIDNRQHFFRAGLRCW